jgi:hypothetical protein
MTTARLNNARGRALWANAEYLKAQTHAYRSAAAQAEIIGEVKIANDWRNKAKELEQKAFDDYKEARELGIYNDPNEESVE